MWFHSAHLSATLRPLSALRGKNDTKQYPFVRAYLSGSADMSATIRRDHIVDPVVGNRRPFAVHLDFVMVANHAALRRATVHEVTAGASAVVSVQLRIKLPMPPIVADPVISFLRHRAYTEEHGHHADCGYPSPNIRDHKAFPQWDKKTSLEARFIDSTTWPLPGIECAFPAQ